MTSLLLALSALLATPLVHGPLADSATGPAGIPPAPVPWAVWRSPVDPLTVIRPFEAPSGPYAAGHRGVDLEARPGAPVLSAGFGRVAVARRIAGRWVIAIEHPPGLPKLGDGTWRTTYEAVRPVVAEGDLVREGQRIGTLVGGGHCACLHWGLKSGRTYADPLALLRRPTVLKPISTRATPIRLTQARLVAVFRALNAPE